MNTWTLAVDAGPSHLAAAAVDPEATELLEVEGRPRVAAVPDTDDPDRTAETVARALADLHRAGGGDADALVMVTPGATTATRFTELAEAAALAGLPHPAWVPDAVARAGDPLVAHVAEGGAAVVLDARDRDVPVWGVRRGARGAEVGAEGALSVGPQVDDLLVGVVRAKLGLVAPDLAEALDHAAGPEARRDAAHLRRELRKARRLLCEDEGDGIVVRVGGAEVSLERSEFAELLAHATRQTVAHVAGALGADARTTIVVAEQDGPLVQQVVQATGAVVALDEEPWSALHGVRSLLPVADDAPLAAVQDDPPTVQDDPPTVQDDPPTVQDDGWGPHPDAPRRAPLAPDLVPAQTRGERPPRWAVPALSTALVVAVLGAVGVLALGPASIEEAPPTPQPAAVVLPAPAPALPVTAPVVMPVAPPASARSSDAPATTSKRTTTRRATPQTATSPRTTTSARTTTSPRSTRAPGTGTVERRASTGDS